MSYSFKKKFTEIHIDSFIEYIKKDVKNRNSNFRKLSEPIIFDLSETERISNQNLLLLTSVWKYLIEKTIDFKVKLFRDDFNKISKREAENIIQLLEVWKVYEILPDGKTIDLYFNIPTGSSQEFLKTKFNIEPNKLFSRYGVTPFISLEKIENFKDYKILKNKISPIYDLNSVINRIIKDHNCDHPFTSKTISAIITKELYENFLDHFESSFFGTEKNWAFLSLAIKSKVRNSSQGVLEKNFNEEELLETKSFFKQKNGEFKNENLIQFSFLDYGNGIVETIRNEYNKKNNISDLFVDENEILKYAFKHDTSKFPIYDKYRNIEKLIPRGLFDILCIVKRYGGLIIIRSNSGKIAYDFSNDNDFEEAFLSFGEKDKYFPGTFISIYIPASKKEKIHDTTSIKPILTNLNYSSKIPQDYISLFSIINDLSNQNYSKSILYQKSIEKLKEKLLNNNKKLFFIDFQGWETDSRISKVLIFYLASDYDINLSKNIVILNPPDDNYLKAIKSELLYLLEETKSYQTHPLPFISFNNESDEVSIFWLGVYNKNDIDKLKKLLFKDYEIDLRQSDFEEPDSVIGNLSDYDDSGNIVSIFPNEERIQKFYKKVKFDFEQDQIAELLNPLIYFNEQTTNLKEDIFLCSGNYYTKQYLRLDSILTNELKRNLLANLLYKRINQKLTDLSSYKFIAVTSNSNKILKSLVSQKLILAKNSIFIENYHKNLSEHDEQNQFNQNGKYVLICDVIATGYLTNKINKELKDIYKSELSAIAVFIDSIDDSFSILEDNLKSNLISLQSSPIIKFLKKDLDDISDYNIIRVNPFTNQPILLNYESINNNSVLLTPFEFIKYCDDEDLKIKYLDFNNAIHPYFFDMESILRKKGNDLLSHVFNEIPEKDKSNIGVVFYPQKSAVDKLDFDFIKSNIFKNQGILDYEIERFPTKDGWKFPHLSTFYKEITKDKKLLILDDAACSGDSILQLIDEVSFLEVKEIVIIILLARVSDQRAEFFSKLSEIKNSNNLTVPLKIYFGCHWQISTYSIYSNPVLSESAWLESVISMKNTPSSIRNIASTIKNEIKQINYLKDYKDYKYFPRERSNSEIAKKELFLTRNHIGKIIGFRFYLENFKPFDKLIQNNRDFKNREHNKEIEGFSSIFLYEPFLFEKIQQLLPDVAELIRSFVVKIIFLDELDMENNLYYKWDRKDIVHLFFIVYKGNSLVQKLKEDNLNFLKLLNFSQDSFKRTNPINYLFYKILNYFPFTKEETTSKESYKDFKTFLNETLDKTVLDKKSSAELRRFYSFINTLPSAEDFESQKEKIKNIFWENEQPKLHDEQKSFNQNISKIIAGLRDLKKNSEKKNPLDEEKITKINENWWNIKHDFIEHLITFYRTFGDFFKPYPYNILLNKLENKAYSLIEMYSFLDDFISNVHQRGLESKYFDKAIEFINIINQEFGLESEFRTLFDKPNVSLDYLKSSTEEALKTLNNEITIVNVKHKNIKINIPELYIKKLLIKELYDNLNKYSEENSEIKIVYEILNSKNNSKRIQILITNKISKSVDEFSGNEGLNNLKLLSESILFNFKYSYSVDKTKNHFIQKISFNYEN